MRTKSFRDKKVFAIIRPGVAVGPARISGRRCRRGERGGRGPRLPAASRRRARAGGQHRRVVPARTCNRYAEVLRGARQGRARRRDHDRRRGVPGRAARPATKSTRRSPPPRSAARSSRSAGCTRSPAPRAWPPTTRPARSRRRRRRGGCPRRSPSTRSSGCSTRPGQPTIPIRGCCATARCSSSSTGPGRGSPRRPALTSTTSITWPQDPAVRLSGKGGKQRYVPVGSYAVRALDAYLVRGVRPRWPPRRRGKVVTRGVPQRPRRAAHPAGRVGDPARSSGPFGQNRTFHPTPCGTPSPPTSSTGGPISGSCRSCSDTPQ